MLLQPHVSLSHFLHDHLLLLSPLHFTFFCFLLFFSVVFFFFQAEDGIRDGRVTGVQTCALPISSKSMSSQRMPSTSPRRAVGARRFFTIGAHATISLHACRLECASQQR